MLYPEDEINTLIAKVVSGEASLQEKQELDELATSNGAVAKALWQSKKLWEEVLVPTADTSADVNMDAAWKLVAHRLMQPATPIRKAAKYVAMNSTRWAVAASVLLALFAGLYFWKTNPPVPRFAHVQTTQTKKSLTLPDGSAITMQAHSKLGYDSIDFGGSRAIMLEQGEAYFEVRKDKGRRFIVSTPQTRVMVLGTKFTVAMLADAKTRVSVVEGRVRVIRLKNGVALDSTEIIPGQTAYVSEDDMLAEAANPLDSYWATGQLTFSDMPLIEVCKSLSAAFHTPVFVMDGSLGAKRITATYHTRELQDILQALQTVHKIDIEVRKEVLYLKPSKP